MWVEPISWFYRSEVRPGPLQGDCKKFDQTLLVKHKELKHKDSVTF